jgi:hypothetical protein
MFIALPETRRDFKRNKLATNTKQDFPKRTATQVCLSLIIGGTAQIRSSVTAYCPTFELF